MGGRPWLRHFAFPIAFFLIAVPWPTGIEQPLIQGLMPTVATIATETLSLFGIPAEVQGNLIHINGGVVGVNEACSGVRSLQTSVMIGLLFGELNRLNLVRRIGLIVAAVFIAFVANCGRAFFLVLDRGQSRCLSGRALARLRRLRHRRPRLRRLPWPNKMVQPRHQATPGAPLLIRLSIHSSSVISSLPSARFCRSSFSVWLFAVELGVEAGWYRAHERDLRPSVRAGACAGLKVRRSSGNFASTNARKACCIRTKAAEPFGLPPRQTFLVERDSDHRASLFFPMVPRS